MYFQAHKYAVTRYSISTWIEFVQNALAAPFQALYRIVLSFIGYGENTRNNGKHEKGSTSRRRDKASENRTTREQVHIRQVMLNELF